VTEGKRAAHNNVLEMMLKNEARMSGFEQRTERIDGYSGLK
jgi:hypothetical protein